MPSLGGGPTRRILLILAISAIITISFLTSFGTSPFRSQGSPPDQAQQIPLPQPDLSLSQSTHAIAPTLGNETLKADLGRATWKYFHTVMARFPDSPTADESAALKSYIHLFQRLYPCGECAEHFGTILEQFPPQVSSRNAAAGWACHVHNEVNKSLGKEVFDCSQIGDFYDCGCGEEGKKAMNAVGGGAKPEMSALEVESMAGENGREVDWTRVPKKPLVKVE